MQAKLNNITMPVKDPKKIRDFYVNTFDLKELESFSDAGDFYMLDGNGCTITIQDANAIGQSTGTVGVELGFEVEEVESYIPKIKQNGGGIIKQEQQMGWGNAFTAVDPEGHVVNVFRFQ